MPHYWMPIGPGNPHPWKGRKDQVDQIVAKHGGTLGGFWCTPSKKQGFALVQDPADAAALARELGVNRRSMKTLEPVD